MFVMFLDDSEIDESLPPCIRFRQCMESSSLVHLMHCTVCCVKCLMDCDLAFVEEVLVPSIKNLVRHPNDAVSESMLMNLPDFCEHNEPHDSFYIGSDVFYTYIVSNNTSPSSADTNATKVITRAPPLFPFPFDLTAMRIFLNPLPKSVPI